VGNGGIAFLHGQPPTTTIQRMDPDGSNVATVADAGYAAWSPDGTRLLLAVPPEAASPDWEIAAANADGSGLRRIATGDDPVWSPDGTRIAFVRYGDAGPTIHLIGADGAGLETLTGGWQPSWSPDGSRLAFIRQDAEFEPASGEGIVASPEALWVVDLASGDEEQLTPNAVAEGTSRPTWSPDGKLLAFGSNRLIDLEGGSSRTPDATVRFSDTMPWSPDGEDLIVITEAGIGLMAVDSGEIRPVAAVPDAFHVSWSPDGRRMAYTRVVGTPRLWVVDAGGGDPIEVGPADSQFPAWQPIVSHPLGE
jgi:Tol biopolymer transport system component